MDLAHTFKLLNSSMKLNGRSDATLASTVRAKLGQSADAYFRYVPELDGATVLRPVDILLSLAQSTRPRYHSDLHDTYAHWALFRYLGIFEQLWDGSICLSEAGRRVVGNQRRVLSEELGIGIAVTLAEHWMRARLPLAKGIRVVDVDTALDEGFIVAAGAVKRVRRKSTKRPDYLLIADDPTVRGRFRLAVLECKGTKLESYVVEQLATAAEQIRGIEVAGRLPAALAVASSISDSKLISHVLEWDGRGGAAGPTAPSPPQGGESARLESDRHEFIVADISDDPGRPDLPRQDLWNAEVSTLARNALYASWASLALLAGNYRAFQQWAPDGMREKYDGPPVPDMRRVERVILDSECVGVTNTVTVADGQLEVFLGLTSDVDRALSGRSEENVILAQRREGERRERWIPWIADDGRATAARDDGAVLLIGAS